MSVVMLTKTPLQANMSYIQAGRDRFESGIPAGSVSGLVWADKAGTLYLEESDDDGVTWSQTTNVSVSASTTTVLPWTALTKQQYRFRYVNGAAAQTKFRLVQQTRGMELTTVDLSPLENRIDAITSGDTPATAQLTGSYIEIGGVTYAVSGGDTLRNTAANKPTAADAHAAIPFCYYHAIDTGVIEVTDGTNWVVI
jgi:hypothetical protein